MTMRQYRHIDPLDDVPPLCGFAMDIAGRIGPF
jgi:hypothetical protein